MDNTLGLLYLASPTLPIGSFAYSQGLEKAIDEGRVHDRHSLEHWCLDVMQLGLAQLDLVLIGQTYHAIALKNVDTIARCNEEILASRETAELYQEEVNLGQSMRRLMITQGLMLEGIDIPNKPSFLCCYTMAGVSLGLDLISIKTAFLWSWLENQTAVACKSVPLGQSDAQRIILAARSKMGALVKDESTEAFGSMPGQVMASALHETQYSRLFRS